MRDWTADQVKKLPGIILIGYFGSYARDDWGVGSDLDLIAIVETADKAFERRSLEWDLSSLPVPADIVTYTRLEWEALKQKNTKFYRTLTREVVWTFSSENET